MKNQYPDTALLLLNGLAEVAERVAVRAIGELRFSHIAVLPMKADFSRMEFSSPQSAAEFDTMLQGAASVREIPNCAGVSDHDFNFPGAPNRSCNTMRWAASLPV